MDNKEGLNQNRRKGSTIRSDSYHIGLRFALCSLLKGFDSISGFFPLGLEKKTPSFFYHGVQGAWR